MKFIDFFAGIGGFRRGLELVGHKCIGFCEYDKYAVASYTSMHLITEAQREYLATLPLKQRQKEILKDEYRNGEWYADDIRNVHARNLPAGGGSAGLSERRVRTSRSQENGQGSRETEAALFEKFIESWKSCKKKIDLNGLSMKMLRECFLPMEELTTYQSSLKWTDSGMISNGRISTLHGTSRKTGSAYTLSDILEDTVPQKFFLSKGQMEKIVFQS